MKLLVAILVVAAGAAAEADFPPIWRDYHEEVGIPAARRIYLMEQANDFDGSRIVGGQPVPLGRQPHLGSMLVRLQDNRQSVCACSLLSNTRAITAAHCWQHGAHQGQDITVGLGSVWLFTGGTRVVTSDVTLHPNYNPANMNNDLAMLGLPYIAFTANIGTIRLPTSQFNFVGLWLLAAGFGANGHNQPITQAQTLHEVRMQVITNDACAQVYGPSVVVPSTLCAATTYGGTCPGDSGGSLRVVHADRPGDYVLAGVATFTHAAGCESGQPVGFARMTSFAVWANTFL